MPHYPDNVPAVCSPYLLDVRFFCVRFQYVAAGPTLEGFCQNSVIIIYIHNRDILVALTGSNKEFSRLVCVCFIGFYQFSYNKLCF